MFDNFTRAVLLNAPPTMLLTTLVEEPIQADTVTSKDEPLIIEKRTTPSTIRPTNETHNRRSRFHFGFGT